jgi:hypothetical protein
LHEITALGLAGFGALKGRQGTSGNAEAFVSCRAEEEAYVPVLLLWAVPAVIVVGGVGYYLVRVVH